MNLLTLDPSVNNVGWALFNTKAPTFKHAWSWGTINPQGHNLEMKAFDLCNQLDAAVGEFEFLCTERPAFFSSERGAIAAHMNYTIDLAAINYFVAGYYRKDHRKHFAITATQWKGMVSKTITARRFFKRYPHVDTNGISEHAIDAVMLGRFCIETYLIEKQWAKDKKRILKLL